MQDKIISFLIQWKIIIPLAIVVIVWILWPQPKPGKANNPTSTKSTPTLVEKTNQKVSITSLFGVKRKLKCTIDSAKATIEDSKIAAAINTNKEQNNVVFDGDCLYRWTEGSSGGERSCGLKGYLPLISQFVSNDSLEKIFPQTNELASACKEVTTIDQKVFEIPKKVLFKNKKLI